MVANHIHDALAQVRTMQELVIRRQRFQGYSGKARLFSGAAAMFGTMVLSTDRVPDTPLAHLIGWGVILLAGLLFNYVALGYWFLCDEHVRRNPVMLKPALDALPALATGALLSLVLILREQYDLLFGVWTCCYGLAQVAYRQSLPSGIYYVGIAYLAVGAALLLIPAVHFLNPWPMGISFCLLEWIGGTILFGLNHERHHRESVDQRSSSS